MYLNEALTKLKNLKSKVARVETYIEASAVYYEDQVPEYDYETELVHRANLNDDILELKTRIQITNATTSVALGSENMTLAKLILMNAQLRAEMSFVTKQMAHSAGADSLYRGRTKDDLKKVLAKGCDKQELKRRLDLLEQDKEELERVMASTNASTTLV